MFFWKMLLEHIQTVMPPNILGNADGEMVLIG